MASIARDGKGWRILFTAPDGRRRTLRLGRVDRKAAESIRCHIEALLVARTAGIPVRQETAVWLANIGNTLRDRLVRCGLCDVAPAMTLERLLNGFLDAHTTVAPGTRVVWGQVMRDLQAFFGPDCDVTRLTIDDGEKFRLYLKARGLADYTITKRLQKARQFFHYAVRRGWTSRNPFVGVTHRGGNPADRRVYVPVAHVLRLMDYCPNNTWRLLLALARFGGLRIPSEAFGLKWGDIDWERGRLTVPSPKTASRGIPYRIIPLFPLLRPYLETAWDEAPEGAEFVIPEEYRRRAQGSSGWRNTNLRTTLAKIIRKAGLEPWPRLWHNLRASFESDLAQAFPLATVTKWVGHSPSIALRHYVDPTDTAFEQAANWIPPGGVQSEHSHSGAKSGALVAQKAAQQIPAENGKIEKNAS
jgi:integrase